jgi:hypothetical protein
VVLGETDVTGEETKNELATDSFRDKDELRKLEDAIAEEVGVRVDVAVADALAEAVADVVAVAVGLAVALAPPSTISSSHPLILLAIHKSARIVKVASLLELFISLISDMI